MKTIRTYRHLVMLGAALGLLFAFTPAQAQNKPPIRVGFSIAQTGPLSGAGKSGLLALQMWRDDVNRAGGLLDSDQPAYRAGLGYSGAYSRRQRMAYKRILVPVDGGETSDKGLREAVKMARRGRAKDGREAIQQFSHHEPRMKSTQPPSLNCLAACRGWKSGRRARRSRLRQTQGDSPPP